EAHPDSRGRGDDGRDGGPGPAPGGLRGRDGRRRGLGVLAGHRRLVRPHHPRLDAPGPQRRPDPARPPGRGRGHAGPDADGPRPDRRPGRGARRRGRRLPAQALCAARVAGAGAGAHAAGRRGAGGDDRQGRRPLPGPGPPRRASGGRADRADRQGVRAPAPSHGSPRPGLYPLGPPRHRLGDAGRGPDQRDRDVRLLPAKEARPARRALAHPHRQGRGLRVPGRARGL
ncbi:MAG: hypothetical protein AVDCRST_MAG03-3614, partial [uncultured Rubrobacteraceae bacterium]